MEKSAVGPGAEAAVKGVLAALRLRAVLTEVFALAAVVAAVA
jgi:hypothetical protein